jgi:hypothetical protein
MRRRCVLLAALASLTGCGARTGLDGATGTEDEAADSGEGLASTGGFVVATCEGTPTGNVPGVVLILEASSSCLDLEQSPQPAALVLTTFSMSLNQLRVGDSFNISGVGLYSATTSGERVSASGSSLPVVQGSFSFESYIPGETATGMYDVSFADGTAAQGSFVVNVACNTVTCGEDAG